MTSADLDVRDLDSVVTVRLIRETVQRSIKRWYGYGKREASALAGLHWKHSVNVVTSVLTCS